MMIKTYRNPRARRIARVRAKIRGIEDRPRLSVFRSNRAIYAQLIDDDRGETLVAASSDGLEKKDKATKVMMAHEVGQELAKRALAAGIKKVVFDRRGYRYHGRVRSLAGGAREGGLVF